MRVNKLCYGCSACEKVCPVKVIYMERQIDGSQVAIYDADACRNCNLCKNVCPALSGENNKTVELSTAYCVWSCNEEHVKQSSSGGTFFELALSYIEHGGYVCGAVYDDKHAVQHVVTDDPTIVEKMRGSKYSESNISEALLQVDLLLNEGVNVLFSGTPCQCKAIRNIVRDHNRLICIELNCNGVMYPIVLEKEIRRLEREAESNLMTYSMRHKKDSYYPLYMKADFANGSEVTAPFYQTMLGQIYGARIALKDACYSCGFKGFPRAGDITLGDYHGFRLIDDKIAPSKYGASSMIVNSKKGMQIIQDAVNEGRIVAIQAESIQDAIRANGRLIINGYAPSKKRRAQFKQRIIDYSIEEAVPMVKRYYKKDRVVLRKLTELFEMKLAFRKFKL